LYTTGATTKQKPFGITLKGPGQAYQRRLIEQPPSPNIATTAPTLNRYGANIAWSRRHEPRSGLHPPRCRGLFAADCGDYCGIAPPATAAPTQPRPAMAGAFLCPGHGGTNAPPRIGSTMTPGRKTPALVPRPRTENPGPYSPAPPDTRSPPRRHDHQTVSRTPLTIRAVEPRRPLAEPAKPALAAPSTYLTRMALEGA